MLSAGCWGCQHPILVGCWFHIFIYIYIYMWDICICIYIYIVRVGVQYDPPILLHRRCSFTVFLEITPPGISDILLPGGWLTEGGGLEKKVSSCFGGCIFQQRVQIKSLAMFCYETEASQNSAGDRAWLEGWVG